MTALNPEIYVPGCWSCAKCHLVLVQSNLNAADGTVTARDTPGDKCPNCDSPLWRVTWKQQAKEMGDRAEQEILRSLGLERELAKAIGHIEHMAAWITKMNSDYHVGTYSFEGLGEDMPGFKAACHLAAIAWNAAFEEKDLRIHAYPVDTHRY